MKNRAELLSQTPTPYDAFFVGTGSGGQLAAKLVDQGGTWFCSCRAIPHERHPLSGEGVQATFRSRPHAHSSAVIDITHSAPQDLNRTRARSCDRFGVLCQSVEVETLKEGGRKRYAEHCKCGF